MIKDFEDSNYWLKPDSKARRTIENSRRATLSAAQILSRIEDPTRGWPYRREADKDLLRARDQALIAIIYLLALRVSEAIRLTTGQFEPRPTERMIAVKGIQLSKVRSVKNPKWRERHARYREGWLPLHAKDPARRRLIEVVLAYEKTLEDGPLFPFRPLNGRRRVLQIVNAYVGSWTHYLRMAGLQYLYEAWDYDIVAVSDYVKVDVRTLMHYLQGRKRVPV